MFLTKDGYRIRFPRWRVRRMLLRKRQAGEYGSSDSSGTPVSSSSEGTADGIPAIVANARHIEKISSPSGNTAPVNVFAAIDKGIPYRMFTRGEGKVQTLLLVTKKATDQEFGELSGELPPTSNRNSPEYIRWVQQSLNKILGLKLTEDGIMGPMTRSAIRSFQQKRGLVVDGIVGPQTEAALQSASPAPPVQIMNKWTLDQFVFGSAALIKDHGPKLDAIAEYIRYTLSTKNPVRSIDLVGYTDPVGAEARNYTLGCKRAWSVTGGLKNRLGWQLVNKIQFRVASMGENDPLQGNDGASRRVIVTVYTSTNQSSLPVKAARCDLPMSKKQCSEEIRKCTDQQGVCYEMCNLDGHTYPSNCHLLCDGELSKCYRKLPCLQ